MASHILRDLMVPVRFMEQRGRLQGLHLCFHMDNVAVVHCPARMGSSGSLPFAEGLGGSVGPGVVPSSSSLRYPFPRQGERMCGRSLPPDRVLGGVVSPAGSLPGPHGAVCDSRCGPVRLPCPAPASGVPLQVRPDSSGGPGCTSLLVGTMEVCVCFPLPQHRCWRRSAGIWRSSQAGFYWWRRCVQRGHGSRDFCSCALPPFPWHITASPGLGSSARGGPQAFSRSFSRNV